MRITSKVITLPILILTVLLSLPSEAGAAAVVLSAGGLNQLEVTFTVPVQPASHNALNIGVSSIGHSGDFSATATLLDGASELAQNPTTYVGERYATVGSFFSGVDPIIDYTTIADGSINGRFIVTVHTGSANFDTDNLYISPFGDGGSLSGYEGTITNVQLRTIPEPSSALLAMMGMSGMWLRRKR